MKTKQKIKAIKAIAKLIKATEPLNSNRSLKCHYEAIDAAQVLVRQLNIQTNTEQ